MEILTNSCMCRHSAMRSSLSRSSLHSRITKMAGKKLQSLANVLWNMRVLHLLGGRKWSICPMVFLLYITPRLIWIYKLPYNLYKVVYSTHELIWTLTLVISWCISLCWISLCNFYRVMLEGRKNFMPHCGSYVERMLTHLKRPLRLKSASILLACVYYDIMQKNTVLTMFILFRSISNHSRASQRPGYKTCFWARIYMLSL